MDQSSGDGASPYLLYAATPSPPSASDGASPSGGAPAGPTGRDPVQVLCPYTGSVATPSRPVRCPRPSSSGGRPFGVRSLVPVPPGDLGGSCGGGAAAFVGHGGQGGTRPGSAVGRDDHAFLVGESPVGSSSNPRWKVRPPEALSHTSQSLAVSPDGRHVAAACRSGNVYLWDWTDEDNLARVWRAHYRPATCVAFDTGDGGMLFTGGEDGVVNAWSVMDLVDLDAADEAARPCRTWSEHHLPVTSLCVLPGGGAGSTRLVSASSDRNLIMMEVGAPPSLGDGDASGAARTLARMCLPTGINAVASDSAGSRLYAAGSDGTVYLVDLTAHAVRESTDGAGAAVDASDLRGGRAASAGASGADVSAATAASVMRGDHLLPPSARGRDLTAEQRTYVSELRGHGGPVNCLALLDPSDLHPGRGTDGRPSPSLLASGSDDGSVRIWNVRTRSCVRVVRPWSGPGGGAAGGGGAPSARATPVTSLLAVSRLSPTSPGGPPGGGGLTMSAMVPTEPARGGGGGSRRGRGDDPAGLYRPLRRYVRGTSSAPGGAPGPDGAGSGTVVVAMRPSRTAGSTEDRDWDRDWDDGPVGGRPRKVARAAAAGDDDGCGAEIARLRRELEESREVVERWKSVNNQLLAKINGK